MPFIHDTDGGRLDADPTSDRAVGPMQFIPGTWAGFGTDADKDGVANPQDVDDAALSAARYLCAGGGDLSTQQGRVQAVYRYNHSASYVRLVLALADSYASGRPVPVSQEPSGPAPASSGPSVTGGSPPAVNPSPPPSPGLRDAGALAVAVPDEHDADPPSRDARRPTATSPSPTSTLAEPDVHARPSPTSTAPSPTSSAPSPTSTAPSPTSTAPTPTSTSPSPTDTPTPKHSDPDAERHPHPDAERYRDAEGHSDPVGERHPGGGGPSPPRRQLVEQPSPTGS